MDLIAPQILLVEDNPADAVMMQKGFAESDCKPHFVVVTDGQAEIDNLDACLNDAQSKRPDFMFIDLDLPKIDGYGVLAHVADHSELLSISVFVISGHILTEVNLCAYRWQVAHFFGKPFNLEGYGEIVEAVESLWSKRARGLPVC